jgi:hypothetical protein
MSEVLAVLIVVCGTAWLVFSAWLGWLAISCLTACRRAARL